MSEGSPDPRLDERFGEALVYATRLHADQARKGKPTPYIAHLLAVASLALEAGADEDEAIAALLHDAVEDQGGERIRREVEDRFGSRVAGLVVALSDSLSDTSDGSNKEPWKVRKDRYLAHLAVADPSVRMLSACDKLHNLRDLLEDYAVLGDRLWDRFSAGPKEQLWFYREIIRIVAQGQQGAVYRRLKLALGELETIVED